MSNVESRPYAGTWHLNNRTIVKYTPDALVFLNGDTSLPGCPRCRGRVEIQKFVTSVSVEAGTSPGSHSANVNLSLPRVQGEQVFIDGYNILRAGLEVHIYMRGYFPVRGMFSHLADPQAGREIQFNNPTNNDRLDLTNYATYPYYPVFHGVVTQVTYDYSDGFYTGSLQCASLLHFWQYQNIASAGAWLAQDSKPTNDAARPTLYGHNFNNVHPFGIMYTLYRDISAAAGVEYALSEQSNLAAPSEQGDRQLFDQMTIYWEQRFKTRIQSLRMYGVNGQLFNAAQQAWLGSGSSRDVKGLLPSPTYNDSDTTRTEKDPFSARLSVAKSLGLGNAGMDMTYSPLIQQDDELVNLSMLDMFAFTQAIGEIGPGNVYQTAYQTKMDVAQAVMEVTGYEFYQDVDGDLVFKPPFYNLDVSPNRYYRLEDQDIINISFTEKEPTATYIIVRGTWFAGIQDLVPNVNETGLRGLYIDYKLVAKFGWRPGPTLEITYQTDPKVLFWIGVARLDTLNVDTYSATCTIPIRAEMRPGYPVYIPFCDSYYYVSQLSHQFAFGGQCTTNLTLTCKRSKWHAPGFLEAAPEGKSAIELVRLDRPDLPPRPLEIFDNGIPRIIGFPNVVMALDPRKTNPNFAVIGLGIDYFDQFDARTSADLLFGLLQRDIKSLNAFEPVASEQGADGKTIISNPTEARRFQVRYGPEPGDVEQFDVEELKIAFADYKASQVDLDQNEQELQKARAQDAMNQSEEGLRVKKAGTSAARIAGLDLINNLEAENQGLLADQNTALGSNRSHQLLFAIFTALQPQANRAITRKVGGIPGSDVTLSWFETLSHLKGQYLANSVPGYYRYFSCSHPNEEMQGMPIIEWDDGEREKTTKTAGGFGGLGEAVQTLVTAAGFFPVGNNLFTGLTKAVLALPGIESWLNDPSELRILKGETEERGDAAEENMDLTHAQRLMDISTAVNIIVHRILARADYQEAVRNGGGFVLANPRLLSGFRPDAEPTDAEAYHSAGIALDIVFSSLSFAQALAKGPVIEAAHAQAYNVARSEVLRGANEGLVSGIGFYMTNTSGAFAHMDRRDTSSSKEIQQKNQTTRERYESGELEPPPAGPPGSSRAKKRAKFFDAIGKQDPLSGKGTDLDQAPTPNIRGQWEQNTGESWPAFADKPGIDMPFAPKLRQPLENRTKLGTTPPDNQALPAPPSIPPSVNTIIQGSGPTIRTRDLNTEVERVVVQFKTTVSKPDASLRSPEVELGTGRCRKGIQIASGPQRTPRVLTTDQIQTVSFVRHKAAKFTQLVGTSQTSGQLLFNGPLLQGEIAQKLMEAAQGLDSPDNTVSELFKDPYNQILDDLRSVEVPLYDNGTRLKGTTIQLQPFFSAIVVGSVSVPASVRSQFPSQEEIEVANLTLSEVAMLPGYKTQGGQSYQRTVQALASNYAAVITRQIESKFLEAQTSALEPPSTKPERLKIIQNVFYQAVGRAAGEARALGMITKNMTEEIATKEGKIERPVHSPVFPVSDEKGYEHYGAYRYGRGLSVEPGGTFEFLHSGQDPFQNVTAQTAEEFLQVFTLVKSGKISADTAMLDGAKDAAVRIASFVLEQRQEPFTNKFGGTTATATASSNPVEDLKVEEPGLTQQDRAALEQSVQDLALVVTLLGQTAQGRAALRELLSANGDNPDVLNRDSFDITDTQFARNFVNFAVNYGKSPVFKTTIANAAYQLADLTSHLLSRTGETCRCRGSFADILLAAYARDRFLATEGIDQHEQKAEAFQSEQIIRASDDHTLQQERYSGSITEGVPPDASTNPEGST